MPFSCEGKFTGRGWKSTNSDGFIPEEDAFDYAIENCADFVPEGFHKIQWTQEFREMLVEWFYSGDWVKED